MSDDIVTRSPHDDCAAHGWANDWEYDCTCELRFEIDRLRAIADELYEITVRTWCWHCGVETRRDDRVDATIDRYRAIVDNHE